MRKRSGEDDEAVPVPLNYADPVPMPVADRGISLVMAHATGVMAVIGVMLWCGKFRGGLLWSGGVDKELLFNFHPLLMILGLIFISGEANLIYKTTSGSRNYKKLVHLIFQGIAITLGSIGLYAAYKFHNDRGIDNFYSLHSWLGVLTITAFIFQWTIGFIAFWYPNKRRTAAAVMPWHVHMGVAVFGLGIVTAETGLLEKITFINIRSGGSRYGSESMMNILYG